MLARFSARDDANRRNVGQKGVIPAGTAAYPQITGKKPSCARDVGARNVQVLGKLSVAVCMRGCVCVGPF